MDSGKLKVKGIQCLTIFLGGVLWFLSTTIETLTFSKHTNNTFLLIRITLSPRIHLVYSLVYKVQNTLAVCIMNSLFAFDEFLSRL